MLLSIRGTTDKVTVQFFFYGDDPTTAYNPVQLVKFDDGTSWDFATIKANALIGYGASQNLTAYVGDDLINSLGGNDTVSGQTGNDTIDGGRVQTPLMVAPVMTCYSAVPIMTP